MKSPTSHRWIIDINIKQETLQIWLTFSNQYTTIRKNCLGNKNPQNVSYFWTNKLTKETTLKTFLCFMNPHMVPGTPHMVPGTPHMVPGTPHNVWTGKHPRDNRRAIIKARFLTRYYMLQTTKALLGDEEVLCPLCKSAPEARVHFIAECDVLEDIRWPIVTQFRNYIPSPLLCYRAIFQNPELLTQLILDPTHRRMREYITFQESCTARDGNPDLLCYRMHYRRAQTLGYKH